MGQVLHLASYRERLRPTAAMTPVVPSASLLPYVNFAGSQPDVVGTYHVHVFINKMTRGKIEYVIEAHDSSIPFRDTCSDKRLLKGLIDARRQAAQARRLMLRVRNDSGLAPYGMLGINPNELAS